MAEEETKREGGDGGELYSRTMKWKGTDVPSSVYHALEARWRGQAKPALSGPAAALVLAFYDDEAQLSMQTDMTGGGSTALLNVVVTLDMSHAPMCPLNDVALSNILNVVVMLGTSLAPMCPLNDVALSNILNVVATSRRSTRPTCSYHF